MRVSRSKKLLSECFWQRPQEGLGGSGGDCEISIPKHEEANHR